MTYQSTSETAPVILRRSSETEATEEREERSALEGRKRTGHALLGSAEGEDNDRRLILVGKSGGGKSATGNSILGRKEFESLVAAKTTTLRCQKGQGAWQGITVHVIDTPAIFDSEGNDEIMRREIITCVKLSWPGPHALILVTQVGRFTAEDMTAAKCVWNIFGVESARHTIVLFTCVEDLGGTPLKEYIQKSDNKSLRDLIQQCGNRFCGFNNKAEGAQRESQVSELMEMVQKTVSENDGRFYVNQLYKTSNVQDEDVKAFLAMFRRGRERAAQRPWTSTNIVILVALSFLFLVIVMAIILMVHFS